MKDEQAARVRYYAMCFSVNELHQELEKPELIHGEHAAIRAAIKKKVCEAKNAKEN